MVDAAAHAPEETLRDAVDDARSFFRQIAEKDGRRERAAPLALLELERVGRAKGIGAEFGKAAYRWNELWIANVETILMYKNEQSRRMVCSD